MPAQRKWHATRIHIFLCLLLTGLLAAACDSGTASTEKTVVPTPVPQQTTQNYQPHAANKATQQATLAPDQMLTLTLNLAYKTDAVEQALAQLDSGSSASYLTAEQIAQRYGLSDAQIKTVTDWLQQQKITVLSTNVFHTSMQIQAPAATVEQLLNVKISTYALDNQTFFMPDSAPTIPAVVKPYIQSIVGLDSLGHFTAAPNANETALADTTTKAADCSHYKKAETKGFLVRAGLAGAYQFDQLYKQGYQGQGVTIGVAAFSETYDPADIKTYLTCAGVTTMPSIQNVDVNPVTPDPNYGQAGAGESALDIEEIASLAPRANILVYQNNQDKGGAQSMVDLFNRVARDGRVQVLNVSYGSGEGLLSDVDMRAVAQSIQMLALQGISVFVASGDCGSFENRVPNVASVSFPASAPYAVAVGGTELKLTSKNARASETTWQGEGGDVTCSNDWGSGGGVSIESYFKRPAWQVGPGTTTAYNGGSAAVVSASNLLQPVVAPNGLRQVPDVSAAADNLAIAWDGKWVGVAGTSAAAPIWTAGAALLEQALKHNAMTLSPGASQYYHMANTAKNSHPFNDITQGNNQFYQATPGWDYATGWGSPNFNDILKSELAQ